MGVKYSFTNKHHIDGNEIEHTHKKETNNEKIKNEIKRDSINTINMHFDQIVLRIVF